MSRHTRVKPSLYLFCLKFTGWYALAFLPVLVFAGVSGLQRDAMPLEVAGLSCMPGALLALMLTGESGRPRYLLRPGSFLAGFLGYWFIGVISVPILGVVGVTMALFDLRLFLGQIGLSAALDISEGKFAFIAVVLALLPILVASNLAAISALLVRFDSVRAPVQVRGTGLHARVHSRAEHDAALQAMRLRLAQRQPLNRNAG